MDNAEKHKDKTLKQSRNINYKETVYLWTEVRYTEFIGKKSTYMETIFN